MPVKPEWAPLNSMPKKSWLPASDLVVGDALVDQRPVVRDRRP